MNEFWWNHLPMHVSRFSLKLAASLADGLYLTQWRTVGAFAPPLSLLLGFLIGWFHFAPGNTFTFSIWVMALMVAISSFSAGLGAWLWLGYAIGDFILFPHLQNPDWLNFNTWLIVRVPLILSYILLANLLVSIPLTSFALRRYTLNSFKTFINVRMVTEAGLQAILCGTLVFLWSQSIPILIRPVYTWQGNSPPVPAIAPLQSNAQILIALAAILGATRIVLEYRAFNDPKVSEHGKKLQQKIAERDKSSWSLPATIALPLKAAFTTFMLSGMLTNWVEAIILGVSLLLTMLLRKNLPTKMAGWTSLVSRVPLLLRLIVVSTINYFLALKVLEVMWNNTSTFFPIIISTIFGIILFSLLMPIPRSHSQNIATASRSQ